MISVLFATHNGGGVLLQTLEAMTALLTPEGGWELIVVDNASSDNSSEILVHFANRLPLRILTETRRGKNVSLNAALPFVKGDLIVFTDDDIVVPSNWLVSLRRLTEEQPEYAIFGGRIDPLWPVEPSAAIREGIPLGAAFGIHPENLVEGPTDGGMIWGGNMAVRSGIFDDGARFSEFIGPAGGSYVMGSETELTMRLEREGHRCYLAPNIIVKHQIRAHQFSAVWLKERARRHGRGNSLNFLGFSAASLTISERNQALRFWRARAVKASLRWTLAVLSGNAIEIRRRAWHFHAAWGAIGHLRRIRIYVA